VIIFHSHLNISFYFNFYEQVVINKLLFPIVWLLVTAAYFMFVLLLLHRERVKIKTRQ